MEMMGLNKIILDATAGYRMMWYNKNHPNVLYIDQRAECEPDQVTEWRNLPYPDESFRMVVFDPPHILQEKVHGNGVMINSYGYLRAETWQKDFKDAFTEFWRVLKPEGFLLFKWANTHIQSNEILKLAPCEPLFYNVIKVEADKTKAGMKHIKTLWFCFMKPASQTTKQLGAKRNG